MPFSPAAVVRLRAGDEQAFVALVRCLHPSLLRVARAYVPAHALAEEVVQETWVAVLRGLASFEERASLKSWIFRILINRARTRGVRERRTVPFSDLDGDGDEASVDPARFRPDGMWGQPPRAWEGDLPDRLAMNKQAMAHLAEAIDALPANLRIVVSLRDVEGLEGAEVCALLGLSEANQRVLLHRARSRLRATLEDYVEGR